MPGCFLVCVDVDSRTEGRHSEAALGRDALGSRPAAWSRQLCPLRAQHPALHGGQAGLASQVLAALALPSEAWSLAAGLLLQVKSRAGEEDR